MGNSKLTSILIEASNLLSESTGSSGLRRRIEIEREKSNIRQADQKIKEINELKSKTRSKHKLAEMDKRIDQLNGVKNMSERDMKRSEVELKSKGSKSKKDIDRFGETYALQQARLKTNVDKGVAESMMRKHKKAQNESIAFLLIEASELLNRDKDDIAVLKNKLQNHIYKEYGNPDDIVKEKILNVLKPKGYNINKKNKLNW